MLEAPARGAVRRVAGCVCSSPSWAGGVSASVGWQAREGQLLPNRLAWLAQPTGWRVQDGTVGRRGFFNSVFGGSEAASSSQAAEEEAEDKSKSVVLSKRLPKDFVENTLRPHLESQLLENVQAYTPAELAKIARAYSKYEPRQYNLCVKLADTIIFRIEAFEAVDIIDILQAMYIMTPGVERLWEALEKRCLDVVDQFTALNLMGLVRIFNKLPSSHADLMAVMVPRLRELLQEYEAVELHDMLVSMGQSEEAQQDMDILGILVPEIERRYEEVSLLHAINIVWALSQLKVIHPGLLSRVAQDINTEQKIKDLTPSFMARIVWVYRRCNHWDLVSAAMLPLVRSTASEFRCGEFARLAQALPEEKVLLERIVGALLPGLPDMGRKDFLMFFLGCVHGMLLEIDPKAVEQPSSTVHRCLEYMREEQDNFQRDEVEKMAYLLGFSPGYKHLLDHLPASWKGTKEEVLDYITARG